MRGVNVTASWANEMKKDLRDVREDVKTLLAHAAAHTQQLKTLNGTVAKQEGEIKWNRTRILIGIGGLGAISLIATIVAITKALSIW